MDTNIQENIIEAQDVTPVGESAKKPAKKKFILIGVIALIAIFAIILVVLLSGSNKRKIEIDGKTYAYSAEEGITDIEKACDGVIAKTSGQGIYYYHSSGEIEEVDIMDALDGKYPIVYFSPFINYSEDLDLHTYNVYSEFKTQHGGTHESTPAELKDKDFLEVGDLYYTVTTNKNTIKWSDIEKDYDKIISDNSFDSIDYLESALLIAPDVTKFSVMDDDVQAVLDVYNTKSPDGKNDMLLWLAEGKSIDMLLNNDAEYVVIESIYCQEGRDNLLNIHLYTSKDNSKKILDSMGIK